MISRRVMLRAGAVVGGAGVVGFTAQSFGVLDDGLRAIGLRPHAEPDPRDVALLAEAAAGQAELLAALPATIADLRAVLHEQLAAVSDEAPQAPAGLAPTAAAADLTTFAERVEAMAAARADGALSAGSLDVVKVLASMSAGLEQVAVAARRLA